MRTARSDLAGLLALLCLAAAPAWAEPPADEAAFASDFLGRLQLLTVVENREYCGYFGRTAAGRIVATRPRPGKYNSCNMDYLPPHLTVFANYHTHAAYDPGSWNEIPSPQDLESDIDARIDGYISTPGGRLWFSDHAARAAYQLCGEGCLPPDPNYRRGKFLKVRPRYTLDALKALMGG